MVREYMGHKGKHNDGRYRNLGIRKSVSDEHEVGLLKTDHVLTKD